jgi:hypothetical protein
MPAALQASRNALPKDSFVSGPAILPTDKGKGPSPQNFAEGWQNQNGDGHAGLFGPDRCDAVATVLAPKLRRIASPQSGVKQHGEPDALFSANRPVRLVPFEIVLGPCRKSTSLRPRRVFDAGGGTSLHMANIDCPTK